MDKVKEVGLCLLNLKMKLFYSLPRSLTQTPWQKMLSFTKIHGKLLNTCTFILCQPYSFILTIHKKTKFLHTNDKNVN